MPYLKAITLQEEEKEIAKEIPNFSKWVRERLHDYKRLKNLQGLEPIKKE